MADQSEADLHNAIERLYQIFAPYGGQHGESCPCCVSGADRAGLYAKPLRDLQADDLDRYAFKALTTWGDDQDFRHFLPRMLELFARHDERDLFVVELISKKLVYAGWQQWPPAERDAVARFFGALWRHVIAHFPHAVTATECISSLVRIQDDIAGELAAWRIAASRPAALHFAHFLADHPVSWSPRHGFSFAGLDLKASPAGEQLVRWLRDPARRTDVENAFFAFADDGRDAALLSQALEDLCCYQPV